MSEHQTIVTEAIRLAHSSVPPQSSVGSALESGGEIILTRNDETATLALTLVNPSTDTSGAVMESLIRVSDETTFGDQLIGGCLLDRRLALSAIIPLPQVSEAEVDRRIQQLVNTFALLLSTEGESDGDSVNSDEDQDWVRI